MRRRVALVISVNPKTRDALSIALSKAGCALRLAESFENARALIQKKLSYDLVLIDDENVPAGWLIDESKTNCPSCVVYILSGRFDASKWPSNVEVVPKPLDAERLEHVIGGCISQGCC